MIEEFRRSIDLTGGGGKLGGMMSSSSMLLLLLPPLPLPTRLTSPINTSFCWNNIELDRERESEWKLGRHKKRFAVAKFN